MSKKKPQPIDDVARKFAAQLSATAKTRDLGYEVRAEKRDAEVAKALAAHLAKRKK